jgi:methylated-DNA-[protein]-cysteine S-methyltransferase
MNYRHKKIKTPVGDLHLVSTGKALAAAIFENGWNEFAKNQNYKLEIEEDEILNRTETQLNEYFAGTRKDFDIPLQLEGTNFQNAAWNGLLTIPYGTTVTYSEQAKKINKPDAIRAVGTANGQNKIAIIIPCHRVIGKNGTLTGYAGGIEIKKKLLELESTQKRLF